MRSANHKIKEIIELRESGLTYSEISKRTGIHKSTLHYNLTTWGVEKPHPIKPHKKQILQLKKEGMKAAQICKQLNLCRNLYNYYTRVWGFNASASKK